MAKATPAVAVLDGCVVTASLLAAAAVTVSVWLAGVNGLSLAVNTGLPASVSLYLKLALLDPLLMVTLVIWVMPVRLSKNWPVVEVVARVTVCVVVVVAALLNWSSSCTVIVFEIPPAVTVCAAVANTSLLAAAGLTTMLFDVAVKLPALVVKARFMVSALL